MRQCTFTHPGTMGHECGAPSETVAVKRSALTESGFYYTGRCAKCLTIIGGENSNIIRIEPEGGQKNVWK